MNPYRPAEIPTDLSAFPKVRYRPEHTTRRGRSYHTSHLLRVTQQSNMFPDDPAELQPEIEWCQLLLSDKEVLWVRFELIHPGDRAIVLNFWDDHGEHYT